MLISPRHLVDRLRHPRSRADQLARLRARFATQPSARQVSPQQRKLATRLRALRRELSDCLAEVTACGTCAKGHPEPHGHWQGGYCCGIDTFRVFVPHEVASLKIAGTAAKRLKAPLSDHAGCVFRGPAGCSLEAEDRPNICVLYLCIDLRQELRQSPIWDRIKQLRKAMADTQQAFAAGCEDPTPSNQGSFALSEE
jgi:hypothetical protein